MSAPVWYVARVLDPFANFSAGEKVAVRQVGHDFQVVTLAGLHLTTLSVDEAVKALKSERGPDGYLLRVDAPGVLEMRIQRASLPKDAGELMHMAVTGEERPALGLGRVRNAKLGGALVAWQCWECGYRMPWKIEEPWDCPECGCALWDAVRE